MKGWVDTHVHVSDGAFRSAAEKGYDAPETLDAMSRFGIARAWISPTSGLYAVGEYAAANDALYRFCKVDTQRLEGFFTVNPNYANGCVDEVRRCVEEYGFRGLKLHPWLQGFPISLPAMDRIVEACISYDIPIIFHDGTPPYSSTLQIANLAERYPESTIILGHAGLTETYDNAISAANRLQNIYVCMCGPSIFQLQKIVDHVSPDQLLFGTDFGFAANDAALQYRVNVWNYVSMPEETRRKVFWENAQRLIPPR